MKGNLKFVLLIVFLAAGWWLSRQAPLAGDAASGWLGTFLEPVRARWWAPIAFMSVYVVLCGLGVPAMGLSVAGGILFGLFPGLVYNLIGVNAGASLGYGLSRRLGAGVVKRIVKSDKMSALENAVRTRGLKIIIALRIVPALPIAAINFGSPLIGIRYADYAVGSFIGLFPATLAFTYFSHVAATGLKSPCLERVVLTIVFVGLVFSWKVLHTRNASPGNP
ncbi:MAG: TVP38/TMEM64 family protein [Candidatus Omnitrophica bacterium]|nr:TVP38/TMEM64 family protein [Candidatus Omnitrophota bacterium]